MSVFIGSRYETGKVERLVLTDRTLSTPLFAGRNEFPLSGEYINYLVTRGDRLDRIAYKYLGRAELWWVIADLNPTLLPDPLEPGTILRVPDGRDGY